MADFLVDRPVLLLVLDTAIPCGLAPATSQQLVLGAADLAFLLLTAPPFYTFRYFLDRVYGNKLDSCDASERMLGE